jgi:membrane-associated phospholipid phosphatase
MFLRKNNTLKWNWIAMAGALTIILCAAGIFWFDKPVFLFMRQFDWMGWKFIDGVFATKVWLFASFVLGALLFGKNMLKTNAKRNKESKQFNLKRFLVNFIEKSKESYGFFIFCSVLSASVVAGVLKIIFGRARPIFFEALGQTGFYPINFDWAFNSMPSGHATASFAGLVMLGMLFPKIKWATWTIAIIIGVSRVCYGAHWPTDIILGAFIGMLSADIIKSFFLEDRK